MNIKTNNRINGFTLIEISIVLVVIGLIVGGVLVGQDLINAAKIRAAVSQIEQYKTAVNTFKLKYGNLPGDIPDPDATSFFGLNIHMANIGAVSGAGDGNGLIDSGGTQLKKVAGSGEMNAFWIFLSKSGLTDFSYGAKFGDLDYKPSGFYPVPTGDPAAYMPTSKLGSGIYIFAYSGGVCSGSQCGNGGAGNDGNNYFELAAWPANSYLPSTVTRNPAMSPVTAYSIDQKIDDGMPVSGRVTATYATFIPACCVGIQYATSAATDSSSTCFNTTNGQYSKSYNNLTCTLSFRLQ